MNIVKVISGCLVVTAAAICWKGWEYKDTLTKYMPQLTPSVSSKVVGVKKKLRSIWQTERAYGLPRGVLIAVAEQENKGRITGERYEQHLERTDARVRKLAKTKPHLVTVASTSYGPYQVLGIEALAEGLPIETLKELSTATEFAAKKLSNLYGESRIIDERGRLFDTLLAWNCGYHVDTCRRLKPGKKGFDMAYAYAKETLQRFERGPLSGAQPWFLGSAPH